LAAGETYVLTVSRKGYSFAPIVVTPKEDVTDMEISAETSTIGFRAPRHPAPFVRHR
jgi:hypothetical protein